MRCLKSTALTSVYVVQTVYLVTLMLYNNVTIFLIYMIITCWAEGFIHRVTTSAQASIDILALLSFPESSDVCLCGIMALWIYQDVACQSSSSFLLYLQATTPFTSACMCPRAIDVGGVTAGKPATRTERRSWWRMSLTSRRQKTTMRPATASSNLSVSSDGLGVRPD